MDKFKVGNETFSSSLCDVFTEDVPKSYLPEGVIAERNFTFMPFDLLPYSSYYNPNGTKDHVVCGPMFLLTKEVAIKMKSK